MSASASGAVSDDLPQGPLLGHYARDNQLYSVYSSSATIVRHTPTLQQAPPVDATTTKPLFRQPRYLSLVHPYLLFIPTHYAWRDELFKSFDRPRHKLPIIKEFDDGFTLHPDVAENWSELEICLRAVGRDMLRLAPQRMLQPHVSAWFFPSRFQYLRYFKTEQAARFAAWRSIDYFLPLLGYVSLGLWCMLCWEADETDAGRDPPDWRTMVVQSTGIHRTFLDYVEKSVVGNWAEERVGALYHIPVREEVHYNERPGREELEWLLASIIHSGFPIPIYISWGTLPQQISSFDVPDAFTDIVPDAEELKRLASPRGHLKFSRWKIETSGVWSPDPYMPAVRNDAPRFPLLTNAESSSQDRGYSRPDAGSSSSRPNAKLGPFPPLPSHSQQRINETIEAFFIRRRAMNEKEIAVETAPKRQSRLDREAHARKGTVPSKAVVFFWEKQDGHYIRQAGGRKHYEDLWEEYPPAQRQFWSIQNEWDLCEVFEENDPVFGPALPRAPRAAYDDDDDDDDDDGFDPGDLDLFATFPQNIEMSSRLRAEDVPQADTPMQAATIAPVEMEPPQYIFDDVPGDDDLAMDLGGDFTEAEIPTRNVAKASQSCVHSVYLRFGQPPPRTEEPQYEPCAQTLLKVLEMRYGFVMPRSPEMFTPREKTKSSLNEASLPAFVGLSDIGGKLASQKGLAAILDIFFSQCLVARTLEGIDTELLDFHQAGSLSRGGYRCFDVGRRTLKNMRHPSLVANYYVLRKLGAGIGSEVLLIERATDLLEVLRQGWGPEIQDVALHFIARGISFRYALLSAEVMAEGIPLPTQRRPGWKPDITSGLGYRPEKHEFDVNDYNAYTTTRDLRLLHTPRGHVALQHGGIAAWLARSAVADEDAINAFRRSFQDIYDAGNCLWDGSSPFAYWYHELSEHEMDLLCGVYHVATGQQRRNGQDEQTACISWWPRPNSWARGNLDGAWWMPECEAFYQKRLSHLAGNVFLPTSPSKWRHNLKFRKEQKQAKEIWEQFEHVAASIVQRMIEMGLLQDV